MTMPAWEHGESLLYTLTVAEELTGANIGRFLSSGCFLVFLGGVAELAICKVAHQSKTGV